jgi:hypothetical protein
LPDAASGFGIAKHRDQEHFRQARAAHEGRGEHALPIVTHLAQVFGGRPAKSEIALFEIGCRRYMFELPAGGVFRLSRGIARFRHNDLAIYDFAAARARGVLGRDSVRSLRLIERATGRFA